VGVIDTQNETLSPRSIDDGLAGREQDLDTVSRRRPGLGVQNRQ
jgi:hypothetical protein